MTVRGGAVQRRPSSGGRGLDGRAAVEKQSDCGLVAIRGGAVSRLGEGGPGCFHLWAFLMSFHSLAI